ncbi:MAG: hypothetical protein F6K56_42030 [Moorea sp. SIO3G5]|nr:hypothetical protein [Moorena sp. SIO3G5]
MNSYRRFNLTLAAVTFPSLFGFGLLNAAVDPYGVINSPELPGLNQLKPEQFNHVRLFKAIDVIRNEPKIVLLGSSRTDLGLNPNHPGLEPGHSGYNLALVGPNMYEVKRYFDHALTNQPDLKTVVIGIDFFMFNHLKTNAPDFKESLINQETIPLQEVINSTLSLNALNATKSTLSSSIKSKAYFLYDANGMRFIYNNKPKKPLPAGFQDMLKGLMTTEGYYKEYRLSDSFLNDLQDIVDTCKEKGIELKVFISPSHATQWESLRVTRLWPVFEEWKRQLVEITPVWDFSGYNSITTEAISEQMKNYWDSSHYREEVGDLILNRLFSYQVQTVPEDFGVIITPENVESHLGKIRNERESWAETNPDLVKLVEDLNPKSEIASK